MPQPSTRRSWKRPRWIALGVIVAAAAALAITLSLVLPAMRTHAVSGAAFTTVDEAVDGSGHCQNSPNNCNIYDGKQYVWLNGGPVKNGLSPDGQYFFAVLDPGGQMDPNDGSGGNLSSGVDAYTNRSFTVAGGEVSGYGGNHWFDSGAGAPGSRPGSPDNSPPFIRLAPYDNTSNPGGVYILAICYIGADGTQYPVTPSSCKFDAFKVNSGTPSPLADLTVDKTAVPSFTRTFNWTISKTPDKTSVKQVGGTVTFNYTVVVTKDGGTDSNWQVSGNITISNSNPITFLGVHVVDTVNDTHAGTNGTCLDTTVDAAPGETGVPYTCSYSAAPTGWTQGQTLPETETNTVTISWDPNYGTPHSSASRSVDFTFNDGGSFNPSLAHDCVNISDSLYGTLPSTCATKTYTYSLTFTAPRFNCTSFPNTVTLTAQDDANYTRSASATVQICGPAKTGALTMGFWQNKNGQGIITSGASSGSPSVCNSGAWLRQFAPFQDLTIRSTGLSCAQVATYVYNVIKAATAGGSTMNPMLKAQMLATALDVYFSDPTLGGNRIGAPVPIGGVAIDLTKICAMIDGSGGGSCSGAYENVSSAFGGATSLTVSQMLSYAAGQSNSGGSVWYGNVKATQGLAKDAFDAINNQVAFAA